MKAPSIFSRFCLSAALVGWASTAGAGPRYLDDTLAGLRALRGENGLIADEGEVAGGSLRITNEVTSPTDIALDLLTQLAVGGAEAERNIYQVLGSLERAPRQPGTGLFFQWYSVEGDPVATDHYVSSVDNLHLALALWTLRAAGYAPAGELFAAMDFMPFYDPATGLIAGGMQPTADGWTIPSWRYSYFGSESRSLYSVGWALGLIRDPGFLDKAFASLTIESTDWQVKEGRRRGLRVWDGGSFQLYLPQLLLNEAAYSPALREAFTATAERALGTDGPPAAYSAGAAGSQAMGCGGRVACYNGKAGFPWLVATLNRDFTDPALREQWDSVFAPHAAFLAGPFAPAGYAERMRGAEKLGDAARPLFEPGLGWLDGYRLKAPFAGQVIPVLLSLDQEMIALALLGEPGRAAQALAADPVARRRLQDFYSRADRALGYRK